MPGNSFQGIDKLFLLALLQVRKGHTKPGLTFTTDVLRGILNVPSTHELQGFCIGRIVNARSVASILHFNGAFRVDHTLVNRWVRSGAMGFLVAGITGKDHNKQNYGDAGKNFHFISEFPKVKQTLKTKNNAGRFCDRSVFRVDFFVL